MWFVKFTKNCYISFWRFSRNGTYFRRIEADNDFWSSKWTKDSFGNFRSAWKKSKILFGKIEILGNCLKIHNKVWDIDLDELNRKTACWLSWTKIFEKFGFKMESVNHPKSCYSSFWWFCKNGRYFRRNKAQNNFWRWKSTK